MFNECISPEQSLLSVYTHTQRRQHTQLTVLLVHFLLFVAPTFTLSPPTLPPFLSSTEGRV